jgi:hypothetical protein
MYKCINKYMCMSVFIFKRKEKHVLSLLLLPYANNITSSIPKLKFLNFFIAIACIKFVLPLAIQASSDRFQLQILPHFPWIGRTKLSTPSFSKFCKLCYWTLWIPRTEVYCSELWGKDEQFLPFNNFLLNPIFQPHTHPHFLNWN